MLGENKDFDDGLEIKDSENGWNDACRALKRPGVGMAEIFSARLQVISDLPTTCLYDATLPSVVAASITFQSHSQRVSTSVESTSVFVSDERSTSYRLIRVSITTGCRK